MRLSRRTNTIILWILSIGLVVGMIITFTPTMGGLFGGQNVQQGQTMLRVNGEPMSEVEVARARQSPIFSAVNEGQVAEDLELLLVDQLVRQEVFDQEASRMRVSNREVRQEVDEFRESSGVAGRANDRAYLQLIGQSGFDDQSFREYIREQLRRSKYEESLLEDVEVSDAEVETYYQANTDAYQSDERILARVLVVDDSELASELYDRAASGEDFAQLASEYSLERADRAGALGAPSGSTEPQPVSRVALPEPAANAAFGLPGPGLTEPVEVAGRWYLVNVEEIVPRQTRPFEEVADQVREDALAAKQAGVVQRHVQELKRDANIEIPEGSDLEYDNDVVARVGDQEIMEAELVQATYSNQQIQQSLSPELAPLIIDFFKPTVLDTMIDRKLAYLGAAELDAEFVGGEAQVAQQALAYVSRDAAVDEEAVVEFYESNTDRFTEPAQANVTEVEFDSQEAAQSFREALLQGEDLPAAAEDAGGVVSDRGTVFEGELSESLDRALFGTDAFEALPEGEREVSDVLVIEGEADDGEAGQGEPESESDEEAAEDASSAAAGAGDEGTEGGSDEGAEAEAQDQYVVLVALRIPERVRPLEEVREQVEQTVLQQARNEMQTEWLDNLREEYEVENLLAQQQTAQEDPLLDSIEGQGAQEGTPVDGELEAPALGAGALGAESDDEAGAEEAAADDTPSDDAAAGDSASGDGEEPAADPEATEAQ